MQVAKAKKTAAKKKSAKPAKAKPAAQRGPATDGLDAKTRLDAALAAIDMAEDGAMISPVVAANWRAALRVTCSSCSADVGELCVVHGKGSKSKIAKEPCSIRFEEAMKARQLIDSELAKRGQQSKSRWAGSPEAKAVGARALPPGIEVELRWDGAKTKRGMLVRWNGAGNPVVRVRRVDAKGEYMDEFGSERVMVSEDIIGPFRPESKSTPSSPEMNELIAELTPDRPPGDAKPAKKPRASRTPAATPTRQWADAKTTPIATMERVAGEIPVAPSSSVTKPETPSAKKRSGACKIAGCPARFENTAMPPDWRDVDGFLYCPPHAMMGMQIAASLRSTEPAGNISDAQKLAESKVATKTRAASRAAASRDVEPTNRIGEAWNACEFRIPPSKVQPNGERCVKSFGGTDAPKGWTEIQLVDGTIEYWCEGHRNAAMTRLAQIAVDERKELPDLIRDTRRADGMPEADIVALERVTGGGEVVPRKNDNVGACSDPTCRARFYTRMPSTWEWWKGAFHCPKHIPEQLRSILEKDALDVMPDAPVTMTIDVIPDATVPPGFIVLRGSASTSDADRPPWEDEAPPWETAPEPSDVEEKPPWE